MEELISVIVPVYKVEEYLPCCLDSILKQTYKNLEIIIVDDGSPDRCPQICDEYAKIDDRIKVIHKKNGGLSDARNAGIDCAAGEYISFVDSDDYIAENFYDTLYKNIKAFHAEVSVCDYIDTEQLNWYGGKSSGEKLEMNSMEALEKLYFGSVQEQKAMVVAWNKLYKREIFKSIRYPVGKRNEDEFVIQDILYQADKIVYTDAQLYYYLQRENSIMGFGAAVYDRKRMDQQEAYYNRIKFFQSHEIEKLYKQAIFVYLDTIFVEYGMAREKNAPKEIQKQIKNNFRRIYRNPEFPAEYSIKQKIKYRMFCICPNMIYRIFGLLRVVFRK